MSNGTAGRFVASIFTISFAIAFPEPWNTFLVIAAASMLATRAIGNTGLRVTCQVELIRAGTFVAGSTLFNITFQIQIGRFRGRRQQAKMRASSIHFTTWIGEWNLPQRVADVNIVRSMRGVSQRL